MNEKLNRNQFLFVTILTHHTYTPAEFCLPAVKLDELHVFPVIPVTY